MENPENIIDQTLLPGAAWSWRLKRGTALTLVDLEGDANVSALFFNADDPLERYNMPDTLKAQFIAYLSKGHALYSDMGRILLSIVEDTCGWHDTLGGHTDGPLTAKKYGKSSYQVDRNNRLRNARENFLVELGKFGLGKKDLPVNLNLFSKVVVDENGNLSFGASNSRPGSKIILRAEMNVLLILSNTPHPMDPNPSYCPKPIRIQVSSVPNPLQDDLCRTFRPENERGFQNTEALFLG